jgi:hypothetical protein
MSKDEIKSVETAGPVEGKERDPERVESVSTINSVKKKALRRKASSTVVAVNEEEEEEEAPN